MEAVPIIRQKFVDLTATPGHGLLSEMSIAEVMYISNYLIESFFYKSYKKVENNLQYHFL